MRPLVAGHTELIGSAAIGSDGRIAIEGLNLTATGFGLALLGSIDPAAKTADVTFDLVGGAADHYAGLAPGIGWTGWRLNAHLAGPFALPSVDATLAAEGLSGRGYGASKLDLSVKGKPDGDALALDVSGTASGLTSDQPQVTAALGTTARFTATGTVSPTLQQLTAASVTLTPLDLSFEGSASAEAVKGRLHLPRLDLAAFASLTNRPLSGSVRARRQHRYRRRFLVRRARYRRQRPRRRRRHHGARRASSPATRGSRARSPAPPTAPSPCAT